MKIFIWILFLLIANSLFAQWNNGQSLDKDANTEALLVIDYEHHEVHSGDHFFISGYGDLSSGDTLWLATKTPNTTETMHMIFETASSGIATFYLYEGATIAAGGDTLTPKNSNRRSSHASALTTIQNAPISSAGTVLDSLKWGSRVAGGGSLSRDNEILLKKNSTYLWIIVSGAASNVVNFHAQWYEHTSKED